jgi:hypothetical protein
MRFSTSGQFWEQLRFLRRQFLEDDDLPFSLVLSEDLLSQALATITTCWLARVYSPLITLWVFLGQDSERRQFLSGGGRSLDCPSCFARERALLARDWGVLPGSQAIAQQAVRQTGRALEQGVDLEWLWKRRRVYVYDGSSVSWPDASKDQRAYPQSDTQKPGLGFPLARIAAVFSLAWSALLEVGIRRYADKGQSELRMLRTLWNVFRPGRISSPSRVRPSRPGKSSEQGPSPEPASMEVREILAFTFPDR